MRKNWSAFEVFLETCVCSLIQQGYNIGDGGYSSNGVVLHHEDVVVSGFGSCKMT